MISFDFLKIPIFPRINRTSRPPSETRAANATYLLLRWNQLCDELDSAFTAIQNQLNNLNTRIGSIEQWIQMFAQSFYLDTPNYGIALEAFELGIRVRFTKPGFISAIRFLKPANETGSHIGRIWSSEGTLLRSVPFVNESAEGWQIQALNPPFRVEANTDYVVSVPSNATWAYLLAPFSAQSKGDLIAVREVYSLQVGEFPSVSGDYVDYLRDVVFTALD